MFYPAQFEAAPEGGFVVTFRDIPEAITQGDTAAEAVEMAKDALIIAMDFYFEDRRAVPAPSTAEEGDVPIPLPASIWSKVLLLNTMTEQRVTPTELARRMDVRPQEVTRIMDLSHATKIDTIEKALAVLDQQLQISVA